MEQTDNAIRVLSTQADARWIAGRVYTLLVDYFVSEPPESVVAEQSRIWIDQLKDYPRWAIDAACIWWGSRHNKYRHRKPMHGDIAARCEVEIAKVRLAQTCVDQYRRHGDNPPAFMR